MNAGALVRVIINQKHGTATIVTAPQVQQPAPSRVVDETSTVLPQKRRCNSVNSPAGRRVIFVEETPRQVSDHSTKKKLRSGVNSFKKKSTSYDSLVSYFTFNNK